MIDSKLILLEGLPSTGKSTNSSFILSQLNYNGISARWVHEVARPHPTLYFDEACLNYTEYNSLIEEYPAVKIVLDRIAVFRDKTIGIDLLELEWNYINDIGEEALNEIKQYDVWKFPLEKYIEVTLEKWEYFVRQALKESDKVILLDSSIFQYQIFTFLLKNVTYECIEEFIAKLFEIIRPLKPSLIYLWRKKTEDTIVFLEKERGQQFMKAIWERDQHEPYYQNRPNGLQSYIEFLLDYGNWAYKLFESAPCRKISIDITEGNWSGYEQEMLSFLDIKHKTYPEITMYEGIYENEYPGFRLEVNNLVLTDPNGGIRKLIPKAKDEFFVQYLPVVLRFESADKIVISGDQICERWTTLGTVFEKID